MATQIKMFEPLTHKDMKELGAGKRRVLALMFDHQWHSAAEIRDVAQGSEGLRRLRELKSHYTIEKRRIASEKRHYEYRLVSEKFPWEIDNG